MRFAGKTVEIFHKGQRVASHERAEPARPHADREAHPSSHRRHAAWTPARLVAYAKTIGPSTAALFEAIMAHRPPPEQGFRTDLDILALTRSYDKARMDAACRRGVSIKVRSVASIRSILKIGLDRAFSTEAERSDGEPLRHGNIRGRDHFHRADAAAQPRLRMTKSSAYALEAASALTGQAAGSSAACRHEKDARRRQ